MSKQLIIEIVVFFILTLIAVALLVNKDFLMPTSYLAFVSVGFIVSFIGFVMFFWREKAVDEREILHIFIANRLSLLFGSIIAICGIVYQAFSGNIDVWLFFILIAFISAKIISRIHSQRTK